MFQKLLAETMTVAVDSDRSVLLSSCGAMPSLILGSGRKAAGRRFCDHDRVLDGRRIAGGSIGIFATVANIRQNRMNFWQPFDLICVVCGNSNQSGLNVAIIVGSSLMSGLMRNLTAVAVAVSICAVPAAAIASSPAQPVGAVPVAAAPTNPWLALSAMTTSSSAASAAAAAQDYHEGPGFPPWPVLAVILATIAVGIYILTSDNDGHVHLPLPEPVSPA
jgi:hypothetical protein